MTNRNLVLALALLVFGSPSVLLAGDDPSIQGELRKGIQASMTAYIDDHTVDGTFWHYDAVTGAVLELEFQELHAGIVKKGKFYVSCADFTDPAGQKLDLDFLVVGDKDGLTAVQGFVHKIGDEKRSYDLVGGSSQPEPPEHPTKKSEHPTKSEHPK